MGIIPQQQKTKAKRTDDTVAALELAARLQASHVYGIPVATLRATEFARLSPADMPAKKLLARELDQLTKPEMAKIVHMAKIFHHGTPKSPRGIFNMEAVDIALHAHEIWGYIRKQIDPDRALTGSFTVTNPATREKDHAHIRGKDDYYEASAAVVVLDDRNGPEDFFSAIAGPDSTAQDFAHLGLGHHAFQYLVLEHEYAHVSGAAEAQADMMAAAQYMKKFGADDVPRAFADARAMDAVWKTFINMAEKSKAQTSLKERFNPLSYMRRRKAAKSVRTYNWSNVVALDSVIDKGVAAAQNLTQKDIHDMRFQDVAYDEKKVEAMVFVLQDQARRKGMKTLSMKGLADVAEEIVAGSELMPEMLDKTPGMRDVIGLIRRFKQAADNLYNRAPNPQLEMLKKFKGKLPVPPQGPKPTA